MLSLVTFNLWYPMLVIFKRFTVFLFVHDLVFPYPFWLFHSFQFQHSYCGEAAQAALLSAGCVLEATKMVCQGDLQSACCVVRPPGVPHRKATATFGNDVFFFASEIDTDRFLKILPFS